MAGGVARGRERARVQTRQKAAATTETYQKRQKKIQRVVDEINKIGGFGGASLSGLVSAKVDAMREAEIGLFVGIM